MLMKYATLWLFTLPLSPCNLYVLFTSHFRLIYPGLSWRHCIFLLPRSQYCVQRMYACMYVCKVYICVQYHTETYLCDTLSGMVRSINTIFQDNTEQVRYLCCAAGPRCQKVKFSRPYSPEGNGRTADPLDVHTATIILEH